MVLSFCWNFWLIFVLINCFLKPYFNCSSSFALSWVDKVTQSYISVIANFVFPAAEEITQSVDQVKIRSISQLIKGISRVLQKLPKYFNSTGILTFFVLQVAGVFPVVINFEYEWFRICYIIIWIISVKLSQTSWCFWIIITMLN